jgi:hypothetical protein
VEEEFRVRVTPTLTSFVSLLMMTHRGAGTHTPWERQRRGSALRTLWSVCLSVCLSDTATKGRLCTLLPSHCESGSSGGGHQAAYHSCICVQAGWLTRARTHARMSFRLFCPSLLPYLCRLAACQRRSGSGSGRTHASTKGTYEPQPVFFAIWAAG